MLTRLRREEEPRRIEVVLEVAHPVIVERSGQRPGLAVVVHQLFESSWNNDGRCTEWVCHCARKHLLVRPEGFEMSRQVRIVNVAASCLRPPHEGHLHTSSHRHYDWRVESDQFVAGTRYLHAGKEGTNCCFDRLSIAVKVSRRWEPVWTRWPKQGQSWMDRQRQKRLFIRQLRRHVPELLRLRQRTKVGRNGANSGARGKLADETITQRPREVPRVTLVWRVRVSRSVLRPLKGHLPDERTPGMGLAPAHGRLEYPRQVHALHAVEVIWDLEVLRHLPQARVTGLNRPPKTRHQQV